MNKIFPQVLMVILIITLSGIKVQAQNNQIYTNILKRYVKNGLVDYIDLKKDKQFKIYIHHLSGTIPGRLKKEEREAFWINAYNAFTLKIVVDNYPVKSIRDLNKNGLILSYVFNTTVWDKKFIDINNKKYSLNDIENKILRKRFDDPRIHFAIVCASIGCPPLRNNAYEADSLNTQLNDQALKFINDHTKNYFNLKKRKAYLSKIFDWYSDDFGGSDKNLLKYIAKYLPRNIAEDIELNSSQWTISYLPYNWNLNVRK